MLKLGMTSSLFGGATIATILQDLAVPLVS